MFLSGGASNSLVLPQLIANALCIRVKTLPSSELGALGISYMISSYLNKTTLKSIINKNFKFKATFYPNKKKSIYLNNKYLKYKKLRISLDKIW